MKKVIFKLLAIFMAGIMATGMKAGAEISIEHFEPPCWWVGMKNPEVQLLVHGPNISSASVATDYSGVTINRVEKVENPNYLFLYLDITENANPGTVDFRFESGKESYTYKFELLPRRTKPAAAGVSTEDVLYLITPDRFSNGSTANDTIEGARADRTRPFGRHGGDIKGVSDHLDYIKDLGFTTVWLNPVQKNSARSYHGYAINDFYAVDPRFGTMQEYTDFIDKCHDMGMKVVMDMILNHCGGDHWWMKDLPTTDWLNFNNQFVPTNHMKWTLMDPHAAPSEKRLMTDGWFTRGMPDLNQRNKLLADYLIQSTIWWIEFAGIDAIRQDTHPYMDFDFSSRWCKEVMEEYPDFNIMGEAWYPKDSAFAAWWQAQSKVNDKNPQLKTVMDFNLAFLSQSVFDEPSKYAEQNSTGLFNVYTALASDFIFQDLNNILIFLDNHDMSRFNKAEDQGLNKYKQGIALLLTTRGIPQVYYGTEILMTGTKEQGDGIIRTDMPGGWEEDTRSVFTVDGRTDTENEAFDYMRTLLNWRQESEAVKHGKLIQYAPVPEHGDCYVYARIAPDGEPVLVVMNGTDDKDAVLDMNRYADVLNGFTTARDVVTGKTFNLSAPLEVPARGTYIFDLK